MTREETKQILMEIEKLYPETEALNTDPAMLLALWAEALADEDYKVVHGCLLRFFKDDTRGYAPKIGQILAMKPVDRGIEDWGVWRE